MPRALLNLESAWPFHYHRAARRLLNSARPSPAVCRICSWRTRRRFGGAGAPWRWCWLSCGAQRPQAFAGERSGCSRGAERRIERVEAFRGCCRALGQPMGEGDVSASCESRLQGADRPRHAEEGGFIVNTGAEKAFSLTVHGHPEPFVNMVCSGPPQDLAQMNGKLYDRPTHCRTR